MLSRRIGVLVGLLAMVSVISACGTTPAAEQPSSVNVVETDEPIPDPLTAAPTVTEAPHRTPGASATMPTPIPGAPIVPDFTLPDLDGQTWTLSQFRGQPVMLFVWATW